MFKKLALFFLILASQAYADSAFAPANTSLQKEAKPSCPRTAASIAFEESLNALMPDCKLYIVDKTQKNKIYNTKMRTAQEACVCYKRFLALTNKFNEMSDKEQMQAQKFYDKAALVVGDAIYDQSNIPHEELFKEFYKQGIINKEEFEHDMRELQGGK